MNLNIGRYKDGVPDGWCWIFSPDDPNQQLGALYVKFEHGSLLTSQAVLVDFTKARAWIGEYSDGEWRSKDSLRQSVF